MNNRLILVVLVCANLILGVLFYALFFAQNTVSITSGSAIGLLLSSISLNFTAYALYREKRKQEMV